MEVIKNYGPPSVNTVGDKGDIYINLENGMAYECLGTDIPGRDRGFVTVYNFNHREYLWNNIGAASASPELFQNNFTQPNWNQNDPTAPDYVKNRPFWSDNPVETVLIEEQVLTSDDGFAECDGSLLLVEGEIYTVTFNGVKYDCVAWLQNDGNGHAVMIGNGSIYGGDGGNDEPFAFDSYDDGKIYLNVAENGECTVSISGMIAEVHKIDTKYVEMPSYTIAPTNIPGRMMPIVELYSILDIEYFSYSDATEKFNCTTAQWNTLFNTVRVCGENSKYMLCYGTELIDGASTTNGNVNLTITGMHLYDDGCLHVERRQSTIVFNEDEQTVSVTYTYREKGIS